MQHARDDLISTEQPLTGENKKKKKKKKTGNREAGVKLGEGRRANLSQLLSYGTKIERGGGGGIRVECLVPRERSRGIRKFTVKSSANGSKVTHFRLIGSSFQIKRAPGVGKRQK